jgi:cytochrome c-type biogenesis protein CcmF
LAALFDGEATSEVGLRAGLTRDLWTAIQPDIGPLMPVIAEGNRRFGKASGDVQGLVIAAIASRYERRPPPATFRIIVSPLVTWIWIGALIVMGGALIAIWPAGSGARRLATAGYAARVGQELGRVGRARVRA